MVSKFLRQVVCIAITFTISYSLYSSTPQSCLLFSITKNNVARIGIVNRESKNLELLITDKFGEVLFSKSVSDYEDYFKLFDLTGMPEGDYKVKLTGSAKTFEKRFAIHNNIAMVVKEKEEVQPVFKLINEDILIISYLNAKMSKVNIFFELNDDVVFEERNITGTPVSKKYSLSRLPHGNYVVKLYSGSKIYEYPLAVK